MPVKIDYTPVDALTKLSQAAGRAEQLVREQELANRNMISQMQQQGADRRALMYQTAQNDRLLTALRERQRAVADEREYKEEQFQRRHKQGIDDRKLFHDIEKEWEQEKYNKEQLRKEKEFPGELGRKLKTAAAAGQLERFQRLRYGPEIADQERREAFAREQGELQAQEAQRITQTPLSPEQKELKATLEHNKHRLLQDPAYANNEVGQEAMAQIDDKIRQIEENPLGEREPTIEEQLEKKTYTDEQGNVWSLDRYGVPKLVLEVKPEESEFDSKYWEGLLSDVRVETNQFTTKVKDEKGNIVKDEDDNEKERTLTEDEIIEKVRKRHLMYQRLKGLSEQQGAETAEPSQLSEKPTVEDLIAQAKATTDVEERRRIYEQGKELGYWQ